MFDTTIMNIIKNIWPMMFIVTVILTTLRIAYLLHNQKPFLFYKEILYLGFALYVIMLFYVVTFQDVSWSNSNFVPFKEMFRYTIGGRMFFKNVIGNMIMFMPYGFFVSYFLKEKKALTVFLLSFIISLTIETTQLMIGRVFDVDDIMLNLLGGVIGYYFYCFICEIKEHLPSILKQNWFYNIIIIILLLGIIFYIFQLMKVGL